MNYGKESKILRLHLTELKLEAFCVECPWLLTILYKMWIDSCCQVSHLLSRDEGAGSTSRKSMKPRNWLCGNNCYWGRELGGAFPGVSVKATCQSRGTGVQSLIQEDPTWQGTTSPVATFLEPMLYSLEAATQGHVPQLLCPLDSWNWHFYHRRILWWEAQSMATRKSPAAAKTQHISVNKQIKLSKKKLCYWGR